MKGKPSVVTPTAAIGTPNPFAASTEVEEATKPTEAVVEIPDNEYLPNQVTDLEGQLVPFQTTPTIPDDLSLSSISTMSSTNDGNELSKAKISALVERIQSNITVVIKSHTYTNIANF